VLLVLWHTAPELMGIGQGTQGRFSSATPWLGEQQITLGSTVAFTIQIDRRANVAHINDETISLRDTNVVLAELDKAGNVRITQRLQVAPELPEPAEIDRHSRFRAVIRREPVLREFLRCDQVFTDPTQDHVARLLCSYTLG